MVPNSRIVPPPSPIENERYIKRLSPYTPPPEPPLTKDARTTRYLSRVVPPPTPPYGSNPTSFSSNYPHRSPSIGKQQQQQQQQQQQIKRKPLGDTSNYSKHKPLPPTRTTNINNTIHARLQQRAIKNCCYHLHKCLPYALTADDAKKKSNGRKGLGKFFKKLGKSTEEDDGAPQVRSIGSVVSVKSSRSHHNIPLAPPPPPPAPTQKQPDDLITSLPQEYRSRLITNKDINKSNSSSRSSSNGPSSNNSTSLCPLPPTPTMHPSPDSLKSSNQPLPPAPPSQYQQHKQQQLFSTSSSSPPLLPTIDAIKASTTPISTVTPPTPTPVYHEPLKDHEPSMDKSSSISTTSATNPPRWSVSTRKSSVSYSIYSTFGGDSFTSQEALDSATSTAGTAMSLSSSSGINLSPNKDQQQDHDSSDDLAQIVANNVQRRNQARVISPPPPPEQEEYMNTKSNEHPTFRTEQNGLQVRSNDDNDDGVGKTSDTDDSDDDDDDDDDFVDATGFSQDDIERERFDSRLSKRLSGGHYGSAGGLLHSIEAAQRRNTRRSNGLDMKPLPKMDTDSTPANNNNNDGDDDDDDERVLSKEDRERMRQKSVDALTGGVTKTNNSSISSSFLDRKDNHSTPKESTALFDSSLATSSFWNENLSLTLNGFGGDLLSTSTSTRTTQSTDSSTPPSETHEANELAERLWDEDESFVTRDHMAEWLGTSKSLNSLVLVSYMDHFEFETLRLDSAFRKLCGKLYFKAEAQQIDRILDIFAKRYWKCNPQSVFGSSDVVYAVVYSLLLLNTDLHVAQGNYVRMTKQAFVKNTMSTIYDQSSVKITKAWEMNMEAYLKDLYNSVKQHQILQPLSDRPAELGPAPLEKRSSLIGGRRVLEMKRNMGAIIRKSMLEPSIVLEESEPVIHPVKSPSSPLSTSHRRKRNSISSIGSGASSLRTPSLLTPLSQSQPSTPYMTTSHHRLSFSSTHSPFMKEGVVVRKHLLENATQKAKHRDWRECYLVVGDGELKMHTMQAGGGSHSSSSTSYQQMNNHKMTSPTDMDRRSFIRSSGIGFNYGTTDSVTSKTTGSIHEMTAHGNKSSLIGTISLDHSLANVLPPPGYNRQRPFVFAIQQSNGGVYLFQAGSQAQVNDWTSTCNYWAARQSKEPLPGGVSNMEYGWGQCLHDVILNLDEDDLLRKERPIGVHQPSSSSSMPQRSDSPTLSRSSSATTAPISLDTMVYDWRPPAPPMVSSNLDEKEQYDALQKHLNMLNNDINEHREIKKKMMVKFPSKHPHHAKVMANWESKSKYLLHEIIKYQNYCDVLEKSFCFQDRND
ncbi:unnamed protein product [Absidia cylindrospora]